jgi:hypothetical protein
MIRIIPIPARTSMAVVFEHPTQSFSIGPSNFVTELHIRRRSVKFFFVVAIFPTFLPKTDVVLGITLVWRTDLGQLKSEFESVS